MIMLKKYVNLEKELEKADTYEGDGYAHYIWDTWSSS